jgi:AraC-like DNA-binding protein
MTDEYRETDGTGCPERQGRKAMFSSSAPLNGMSTASIDRRAVRSPHAAPPISKDRESRIGEPRIGHGRARRSDRELSVRPPGGDVIGTFHPGVEIRADDAIKCGEASTLRSWRDSRGEDRAALPSAAVVITDPGSEAVGGSLPRLLIDEGESLNRLYNIVSQAGCDILFYDDEGQAIGRYGKPATGGQGFSYFGPWLGGVAAEHPAQIREEGAGTGDFGHMGGADGVATDFGGGRTICVDHALSIRASDPRLNCPAAPIFNADGSLIGFLEVSSAERDMTGRAYDVTRAVVQSAARAIEERSFRERHRAEWIIALVPPEQVGCGMLLAVDRRHCVVGADRHARAMLSRNDIGLNDGTSLWALFEKNPATFRSMDMGDISTGLVPIDAPEIWSALITPPEAGASRGRSPEHAILHCRPRLDSIGYFRQSPSPVRSHGGLAPQVLRRVREYIDAHLAENIELEALANTAGLSRCHFARAFKQSLGTAPHCYLMQRRLERARQLIAETELPLAQIALECGFSDQSHFSRRFLQYVGVTPRSFRWSTR